MKLENQVCSLELSKRLKELGVKQESYFWWAEDITDSWIVHGDDYRIRAGLCYSAFTVAELGEMLPFCVRVNGDFYEIELPNPDGMKENSLSYGYHKPIKTLPFEWLFCNSYCGTEANARSKMLIYLLENNLIKI